MTDTDKLEPGWYWVRWQPGKPWTPEELDELGRMATPEFPRWNPRPAIIGPRLTPPGEG